VYLKCDNTFDEEGFDLINDIKSLHAVNEGVFELNFTMKSSSYSRCTDEVHFHCASFLFWTSLPRWSSFPFFLFPILNFIALMKFISIFPLSNFELHYPNEVHFHCTSFLFWTSLPRWSSFQLHLFLVLNFIAPMKFILRALLPNFELHAPMNFTPRALLPNFELHAYTQWNSFYLPPNNKKTTAFNTHEYGGLLFKNLKLTICY